MDCRHPSQDETIPDNSPYTRLWLQCGTGTVPYSINTTLWTPIKAYVKGIHWFANGLKH